MSSLGSSGVVDIVINGKEDKFEVVKELEELEEYLDAYLIELINRYNFGAYIRHIDYCGGIGPTLG